MSQLLFGQLIRTAVRGAPPAGVDPAAFEAALAELESSRLPFFSPRPVPSLEAVALHTEGTPEGVRWVLELRGPPAVPGAREDGSVCAEGRLRVEAREGGAYRVDSWCGGEHLRHDIANPLLLDGSDRPRRVGDTPEERPAAAPAPGRRAWPPRGAAGASPSLTVAAGVLAAMVALYLALRAG